MKPSLVTILGLFGSERIYMPFRAKSRMNSPAANVPGLHASKIITPTCTWALDAWPATSQGAQHVVQANLQSRSQGQSPSPWYLECPSTTFWLLDRLQEMVKYKVVIKSSITKSQSFANRIADLVSSGRMTFLIK